MLTRIIIVAYGNTITSNRWHIPKLPAVRVLPNRFLRSANEVHKTLSLELFCFGKEILCVDGVELDWFFGVPAAWRYDIKRGVTRVIGSFWLFVRFIVIWVQKFHRSFAADHIFFRSLARLFNLFFCEAPRFRLSIEYIPELFVDLVFVLNKIV